MRWFVNVLLTLVLVRNSMQSSSANGLLVSVTLRHFQNIRQTKSWNRFFISFYIQCKYTPKLIKLTINVVNVWSNCFFRLGFFLFKILIMVSDVDANSSVGVILLCFFFCSVRIFFMKKEISIDMFSNFHSGKYRKLT